MPEVDSQYLTVLVGLADNFISVRVASLNEILIKKMVVIGSLWVKQPCQGMVASAGGTGQREAGVLHLKKGSFRNCVGF